MLLIKNKEDRKKYNQIYNRYGQKTIFQKKIYEIK